MLSLWWLWGSFEIGSHWMLYICVKVCHCAKFHAGVKMCTIVLVLSLTIPPAFIFEKSLHRLLSLSLSLGTYQMIDYYACTTPRVLLDVVLMCNVVLCFLSSLDP